MLGLVALIALCLAFGIDSSSEAKFIGTRVALYPQIPTLAEPLRVHQCIEMMPESAELLSVFSKSNSTRTQERLVSV
jgi:hypothetical protein